MASNLNIYTTIQAPCASMGALWDKETNSYVMPHLEFDGIFNNDIWDVPMFIFGEFYQFLHRYLEGNETQDDKEEYLSQGLTQEQARQLVELLDEAKSMGWDKLSY